MTKLAPEWVRTSDPVIRSPARYRWTTAPADYMIRGMRHVHTCTCTVIYVPGRYYNLQRYTLYWILGIRICNKTIGVLH